MIDAIKARLTGRLSEERHTPLAEDEKLFRDTIDDCAQKYLAVLKQEDADFKAALPSFLAFKKRYEPIAQSRYQELKAHELFHTLFFDTLQTQLTEEHSILAEENQACRSFLTEKEQMDRAHLSSQADQSSSQLLRSAHPFLRLVLTTPLPAAAIQFNSATKKHSLHGFQVATLLKACSAALAQAANIASLVGLKMDQFTNQLWNVVDQIRSSLQTYQGERRKKGWIGQKIADKFEKIPRESISLLIGQTQDLLVKIRPLNGDDFQKVDALPPV